MHRITRRAIVVAFACVAALALGGTAGADIIFSKSPPRTGHERIYMTLRALHSGLGLNVPDASTAPGTPIIQWSDGMTAMNGQWEFLRANPATYVVQIRNRWSRQCLTVDSKQPGPVVQRPCDGRASQGWSYEYQQGWYSTITNEWSGLDLNVSGASTALGAEVIQWYHSPSSPNALFKTTWSFGYDALKVVE